jgi:predicted aconitase with swiveling domain
MDEIARFKGEPILAKPVQSQALVSDVPLSFWGGFDPDQGTIIDRRHPLVGEMAAGRVLVLPTGRGSCSGSGVLLEAIHNGVAPTAIITSQTDPIIALGCVLGDELYASYPALILITDEDRARIATGDDVIIDQQGWVTVRRHESN